MSSTKKGDKFELLVEKTFAELIASKKFLGSPDNCKIFRKKKYFSRDRDSHIIFDVSIEIFLPGQDTFSLLVLIECKNYGRKVEPGDVEQFNSKVQQILPAGTKAILAATSAFQKGAIAYAKSRGIGLLRCDPDGEIDWVLTRSPSTMSLRGPAGAESDDAFHALHDDDYRSRCFDMHCYSSDVYTNSLGTFLHRLLKDAIDRENEDLSSAIEELLTTQVRLVPYLENQQIEEMSQDVLGSARYSGGAAPLNALVDGLQSELGLKYEVASLPAGVLGTIRFDSFKIQIDEVQAKTNARCRFTLAHELGHHYLGHQRFLKQDTFHESDGDLESSDRVEVRDISRMEWQANYFAACLLLPTKQLMRLVTKNVASHGLIDRGYGLIFLDGQHCNTQAFYAVTAPIISEFGVSRSVVKIRLKELGLLVERL